LVSPTRMSSSTHASTPLAVFLTAALSALILGATAVPPSGAVPSVGRARGPDLVRSALPMPRPTTRADTTPTPPACRPRGPGVCFVDTTGVVAPDAMGLWARWIVFSAAGDSLEFHSALAGGGGTFVFVGLDWNTPSGPTGRTESLKVASMPAPYLRTRMPQAGSYALTVGLDGVPTHGDSLPYTLRINPVVVSPDTRPTGYRARLNIVADSTSWIAVIPASRVAGVRPSDYYAWQVRAGQYSVLLVKDTVYRVCKLPCGTPEAIVLKPGSQVTRIY
jgi:hypothetical protein